jgi:hypothetical protein
MGVSGDDVRGVSVDLDLLEVAERLEERARVRGLEGCGAEPLAELIWPSRAVGVEIAAAGFAERFLGVDLVPGFDPLVGPGERDLVSLRRALSDVAQKEGEAGAQPFSRGGPRSCGYLFDELLTQQAAPVERIANRSGDGVDLLP